MKIRGLLAGLSFALVLAACGSQPTLPASPPPEAAANQAPPPPDSVSRSGGAMGSGA